MININFILKASDFLFSISALVKWILSVSLNVHTLRLEVQSEMPKGFYNEIAPLKKLKKLKVKADKASELKEVTLIAIRIMTTLLTSSQIVRSCRQVEILRMNATCLAPSDLAKLEPAENKTDITLSWYNGPCMGEVLPVLKRCRQLRRLKLDNSDSRDNIFPPSEVLSDFIMSMNDLSYLHIVPHHYDPSHYGKLKNLRDQVNQLILPRRPNFKFDISSSDYYGYCHDASLERQLQKNPMVV
jgi:hypothetical protein